MDKSKELLTSTQWIAKHFPSLETSFFDGKNASGKIVTNPTYGFGTLIQAGVNGGNPTFQLGVSANSTGITLSFIGIRNRIDLSELCHGIGNASITKYCIKFTTFKALNQNVLQHVIKTILNYTDTKKNDPLEYH